MILPESWINVLLISHLSRSGKSPLSIIGKEKAKAWAVKACPLSVGYHGTVIEGPSCQALLKKSGYLMYPKF
jgi:hypothetical protein